MLSDKENIINRKILIMKSGRTQRRVAEIVGVSRITLYRYLCCMDKDPNTQKKIARAVNVRKEIFWPEFYGNGRNYLRCRRKLKKSTPRCSRVR